MKVLRIDDVSDNCRWSALMGLTKEAKRAGAEVIWNISLCVHSEGKERQMPEDPKLIPVSDITQMFQTDTVSHKILTHIKSGPGMDIILCSHGLVHVDHRLLSKQAQEISILTSCSLIGAAMFCPPYHKWNKDTEDICETHSLRLLKYEQDWFHVKYNKHLQDKKYYIHCSDVSEPGQLTEWIGGKSLCNLG